LRNVQNADEMSYDLQQLNAKKPPNSDGHLRLLGVGSQILSILGAGKIKVIGREWKTHGLSGFGLEIVEFISQA